MIFMYFALTVIAAFLSVLVYLMHFPQRAVD